MEEPQRMGTGDVPLGGSMGRAQGTHREPSTAFPQLSLSWAAYEERAILPNTCRSLQPSPTASSLAAPGAPTLCASIPIAPPPRDPSLAATSPHQQKAPCCPTSTLPREPPLPSQLSSLSPPLCLSQKVSEESRGSSCQRDTQSCCHATAAV